MTAIDINSVLTVVGWLIGGLVVIVGMRQQIKALTGEISLLREALTAMNSRLDDHGRQLSYLRGRADGRQEMMLDLQTGRSSQSMGVSA